MEVFSFLPFNLIGAFCLVRFCSSYSLLFLFTALLLVSMLSLQDDGEQKEEILRFVKKHWMLKKVEAIVWLKIFPLLLGFICTSTFVMDIEVSFLCDFV